MAVFLPFCFNNTKMQCEAKKGGKSGAAANAAKASKPPADVSAARASSSSLPPCDLDVSELDTATKKADQKFLGQTCGKLRECEGAVRSMLCITTVEEGDESQSVQVCRALSGRLPKVEVCTRVIYVVAMPSL